jgi:hypothetical protein
VLAARSLTGTDAPQFTQSFRYAQPRFLTDLRMSRGFALVEASGALLGTQYAYFAQRHGIAGRLLRSERADSAAVGSRTSFSYEVLAGSDARVGPGSTAQAYVGRLVQRISGQIYGPFTSSESSGAVLTESWHKAEESDLPTVLDTILG